MELLTLSLSPIAVILDDNVIRDDGICTGTLRRLPKLTHGECNYDSETTPATNTHAHTKVRVSSILLDRPLVRNDRALLGWTNQSCSPTSRHRLKPQRTIRLDEWREGRWVKGEEKPGNPLFSNQISP